MIRSGAATFALFFAAFTFALRCYATPITVVDDLGRAITLSGSPMRIVSLEPSVTEELFAVGAGQRVVADDYFSDFPASAKTEKHVNGMGPSREMMLGLQPDLIILFDQTFTAQKADDWQRTYGVPVYVENAGTYAGVEDDIRRLGSLAGSISATDAVIASMDKTLHLVQKAVAGRSRPKVFVAVWDRPLMTAGRGTFVDDLIRLAGGQNVAAIRVAGYPTYSAEQLVADNPDILLTSNVGYTTVRRPDPGLQTLNLRAERADNCYAVPDDWTARPGPRLALGLLVIAHVIHPECFSGRSPHQGLRCAPQWNVNSIELLPPHVRSVL